jgi:hypothetical protein
MDFPKTLRQLKLLIRMYNVKKGTIKSIAECCEMGSNKGVLYRMKPMLLKYGILKEVKVFTYSDIFKRHYVIDHNELDRFLMTETFLSVLYDKRIWGGKFVSLIKHKPKEDWNGEEATKV